MKEKKKFYESHIVGIVVEGKSYLIGFPILMWV